MAKILIIGDSVSAMIQQRGLVGQEAGHQIFWLSTPKANLPNVTAFGLSTRIPFYSYLEQLLSPFILKSIIKRVQPDIIHIHFARVGVLTLLSLSLLRYHPLVITTMGGDILSDQSYRGFHTHSTRMLLEQADCITSKSDFLDAALAKIGHYQSKIRRIRWGVDLEQFTPDRKTQYLREKWGISENDLVFFDPRAAQPLYNKHVILTAFAHYLARDNPNAILLISEMNAIPTYIAQLRQQANKLGITKNIRFVGKITHSTMPDYYALADITLSIPSSDGLPQSIYEALASGSFLIVGDLPQYTGVIEDGITAKIVPIHDANAIATALSWIVAHPDKRIKAAQVGRAYVQKYANKQTQNQLVNDIYADLLCQNTKIG